MRSAFYIVLVVAVLARCSVVAASTNADESQLLSKVSPNFAANDMTYTVSRKRFLRVAGTGKKANSAIKLLHWGFFSAMRGFLLFLTVRLLGRLNELDYADFCRPLDYFCWYPEQLLSKFHRFHFHRPGRLLGLRPEEIFWPQRQKMRAETRRD
ncbi:secreted RxLR effector peptide protein, putative [Phytophthora infestans T30-4]|uniref:RxLR effector protein n=1 Tax=Phytophthora infestans (strain T30-4) TaxID=403677 RepID=D0N0Y2_PHYIT|nr:secreted RxLR effector peptide protein, putative [Phytophthora infestans T30-4]EEY67295.1 secreted RxLR effector peptide protein, putative [Phytophthora infestans T30-4]|eukprot:XP_002905943.1 secreted RxLR effector peptide protein, putative [Phytophthora infestans T30-4]